MGIYGRVILKVEVRAKAYWSEIIHDDRRKKEIETFLASKKPSRLTPKAPKVIKIKFFLDSYPS